MITEQPEIVCHRGANEYAPENTYASAQLCVDWRMDYVEIDVITSRDGVLYVFHGPELEKTTNGRGYIFEHTSKELDRLDAGSWFGPQFVDERIPRLDPFLRWIKGKAKVFLDVKLADLNQLVPLIYDIGLEHDCFFWFESDWVARWFRRLSPDLLLKMNAETVSDIVEAKKVYRADIIEIGFDKVNQELVNACRERALKVMLYYGGKDPGAFRHMLSWKPDMVNVNHGDAFARVAATFRENWDADEQTLYDDVQHS
jgi:glycerophosphoryl diester phosphodiesterase